MRERETERGAMAEKVSLHLSEVLSLTAVFISSAYLITDSS